MMIQALQRARAMTLALASVLLSGCLLVGCHGEKTTGSATPTKPPLNVVGGAIYHLGSVKGGKPLVHVFEIVNQSDVSIRFKESAETSCGCTSANLSKLELAPGEKLSLEMSVTVPSRQLSRQQVTATISPSSPPGIGKLQVGLSYDIDLPWAVRPESIRLTGQAKSRQETTLLVYPHANPALKIVEVKSDDLPLEATIGSDLSDGARKIEVSCVMPDSLGPHRGKLKITTDDPDLPSAEVYLECEVVGQFTLSPAKPLLILKDGVTELSVAVRSDSPFAIEGIEELQEDIKVRLPGSDSRKVQEIAVSAEMSRFPPGLTRKLVRLRVLAGEVHEEVVIPVLVVGKRS